MNISDNNYGVNVNSANISASKTNQAGNFYDIEKMNSANARIMQTREGQMFTGVISDINSSDVKIILDNNQTLLAHMAEPVDMNIGDAITFLVKENDGTSVTISPHVDSMSAVKDNAIFKALDINNISPTEKNYMIADSLINNNMPLDKASMQMVIRQAYKFPEADVNTIVTLDKLGIEVNDTTIRQYEDYLSGTHQLAANVDGLADSVVNMLDETLMNISENGGTVRDTLSFTDELFSAICDETDVTNAAADDGAFTDGKEFVEGNNISKMLLELGVSETEVNHLMDEGTNHLKLLNDINTLLHNANDADESMVMKLMGSDEYKAILKEAVRDKLSLDASDMKHPRELDELYRNIYDKTDRLMKSFQDMGGKSGQQLGEQARGMQERLDFIQSLNSMYTYAQIPVRFSEQIANSELFVYMNKKAMKTSKEDVSAMLHLDMEHLGPTDVHVSLSRDIVHTRFYVCDEESARIIDEHMTMLEKAINDSGYSLINETIMKEKQHDNAGEAENMVTKNITGHDIEKSIRRYSFDIRA